MSTVKTSRAHRLQPAANAGTKRVTIARYLDVMEARIAANALETERIRCWTANENTTTTLWHARAAMGGVRLQVADYDVSRAIDVLDLASLLGVGGRFDAQELSPWVCPKCDEAVEGNFAVCWNCGSAADEVEDADGPRDPISDRDHVGERSPASQPPPADGVFIAPNFPTPAADHRPADDPNPYQSPQAPAATLEPAAAAPAGDAILDPMALRAWRAAIFGIFFPWLMVYSIWLLLKIGSSEGDLSLQGTRRCYAAVAVNAILTAWWGALASQSGIVGAIISLLLSEDPT